jgi:hypothetical protein
MLGLSKEAGPRLDNNRLMRLISFLFPLAIIFAVIFAFLWMFATEKFGYALRGLFTGVPAILSCLFILFIYKKDVSLHDIDIFPSLSTKSLTYLFGTFYIGSLVVLMLSPGSRPLYYFFFILGLYLSVFFQIFSEDVNPSLVLAESVLIALNLIFSVTLNYDFYVGTTDILPHIFISEVTALTGKTIPTSLSDYAYFPLYHVFIAEAAEILNISVKNSLFLVTAPVYAITIIFLYYLINYITNNRQISLLSCVLFSASSTVLYYGTNVITRTMAFIMFVVLLYLIYSVNFKKDKLSLKTLSVIVAVFLTLVHNVSLPQLVLLLIILLASEYVIGNNSYISKPFFILLNVIFSAYWFFVAYVFVQRSLAPRLQSQFLDSVVLTAGGSEVLQESLIDLIGLLDKSVFLFFTLIGIGFLLKNYKKNYAAVLGLFALLTLIFYIPNPLNTIWQFKVLFRVDRFMLFVSPFMAFIMGYGLYIFWNYMVKYSKKSNTALLVTLLFSIFILVSSVYSISDSSFLGQEAKHEYFTSEELSGFNHIFKYVPVNSSTKSVYTDYYASRFFYVPLIPSKSAELNISSYDNYRIGDVNKLPEYKGYVVLRTREFLRSGLYFGSEESTLKDTANYFYQGIPENELELESNLKGLDKIYSNPSINIYIPHQGLNNL